MTFKTLPMFLILPAFALGACGGDSPKTNAAAPAPAPAAPAPSGYAEKAVTDGGTVSGTVTYAGAKKDTTVKVGKDMETCANTDGERSARSLVVDGGNVANAVIHIQDVKAGKAWDTSQAKVTIDNKECRFEPHVSVGKLKGDVASHNSDGVMHNTKVVLRQGKKTLANIALPKKDQTIDKKKILKKPGIVDVKCDAHEWMHGYIYVADNPYAAVSGADGKFEIKDVPAGSYTAKIWHETLGEKDAKVTVAAGGTATVDVAFVD